MDDNALYTTWGREFALALDGICECSGHDAGEVIFMTFKRRLSLKEFHELSEADFVRMRDNANEWFETNRIDTAQMRKAVDMMRRHWPLDGA